MGKDPFPSYIDEMLQKRFNKGSLTNLVMCENGIPQLTVVNACYYDNENYHLYVVTYKGDDVKKTISDGDFLVCGLENTEDTVTYLSRIFSTTFDCSKAVEAESACTQGITTEIDNGRIILYGVGENIGHFFSPQNVSLSRKLGQFFAHGEYPFPQDSDAYIFRFRLSSGVLFKHRERYDFYFPQKIRSL